MNRKHPLYELLQASSDTGKPRTVGDVDAALERYAAGLTAPLSSTARAELRDKLLVGSADVAELRREGSNQASRTKVGSLFDSLADAEWSEPAKRSTESTDPADLAQSVPKW